MESKILAIINKKLAEHVNEVDAVQQELEGKREKARENKDIDSARNLMILKDKMMFHKACSMILQDVLDDIDTITKEK